MRGTLPVVPSPPVKLVLEGGGSRAAYAAGVLGPLAEAGLRCEAVVGSSTGAVNAAYFAAGQMDVVTRIWREVIPDGFISYRRLLTPGGRPGLDVDRMIDEVLQRGWSKLDVEAAIADSPALYAVATEVPSGAPVVARPTAADIFDWLRAAVALPVGYNRLVRLGERDLVDGGVASSVPFDEPVATETSAPTVVILTRPMETEKPAPAWWHRLFLRTIVPPAVRDLTLDQHKRHNLLMRRLAEARERGDVLVVDPPPEMSLRRLTRDRAAIADGIAIGEQVGQALAARLVQAQTPSS